MTAVEVDKNEENDNVTVGVFIPLCVTVITMRCDI